MNFDYAEQIARDWNATSGNFAGFVTRFEIDDQFVARYDEQVVGSALLHRELWVPADELEAFNAHIRPPIALVASYYGPQYRGDIATRGLWAGLRAEEQWQLLSEMNEDQIAETFAANRVAVALNAALWRRDHPGDPRLQELPSTPH